MQIEGLMVELINKLTEKMRDYKESILDQSELSQLTMSQYYYLLAVNKLDNPTYSDLTKELKVAKPSVTLIVNKMIQQGYLYKVQNDKDKRVFHLHITEKGEKLIKAEKNISYEFAKNAVSCLSSDEMQHLENIFGKILRELK